MTLAILGIKMIKKKKKKVTDKSYGANYTFADPVQSLSLDFVFVSQGHGVTHTARHRTARHSRTQQGTSSPPSDTNTDKAQKPSAQSALFPGAYRHST